MFDIMKSTVIGRTATDVFAYYVEPENRPLWSDHVLDGRWLTDSPIAVGSVFRITLRQWGRTLQTVREITVFQPDRRLCYTMDTSYLHVSSCQTFEPVAAGTRFTIRANFQFRGVLRMLAPFLKWQQARHLAEEASNLKRALELADVTSARL